MESVKRSALLGPTAEIPSSAAAAAKAAGVMIVAGGGTFYLLSRAGASLGLAALGGAVLAGIGAFAVVARARSWEDGPREVGGLVETATGNSDGSTLAAFLSEHLTRDLTGYLAGVDDETVVERWISGEIEPSSLALGRLRAAYAATSLILKLYDGETAQVWFLGMNQWLDDESPAYVLRHHSEPVVWQEVVDAAQAFIGS